jgi:ComF family protein
VRPVNATDLLRRLGDGLLDLVFAPVCVACRGAIPADDPVRIICSVCWTRAHPLPPPRCPRCWDPRSPHGEGFCALCETLVPGLRSVRSAFVMEPPVSRMVHALKYDGWRAAAPAMARRMSGVPLPLDVAEEAALVVPVPISGVRLRERGYNQAELLALVFADETGRRCVPELLRRTRATESQTALHPDQRRANVARAFSVPAGHIPDIAGEHLLLLDDVWTTGATATACAEALLEGGARAVSVLTFARAAALPTRGDGLAPTT